MAPSTTIDPEYLDLAMNEVKPYEGEGRVIADHYDEAKYTNRRRHFLGRHPFWSKLPGLGEKAHCEAEDVFKSQPTNLPVEVVRQRELELELEPLLPLPTTSNTATLVSHPEEAPSPPAATVALSGRAADVPVKPQRVKRTRSLDPDENSQAGSDEAPPSPPKRAKRSDKDEPVSAASPSAASPAPPRRREKKTAGKAPSRPVASKAPRSAAKASATKAPSAASALAANDKIQRIAAGAILPSSKRGAESARTLRQGTAPEWWDSAALSRAEQRDGPVRCLCGALVDAGVAGVEWVSCDSCHSWQHVECVGEAVSADRKTREKKAYLCFACDPFRHRKGLQKLRRGE